MGLEFQIHELARYQPISHCGCIWRPKPVVNIRHSVIKPRKIWQEMNIYYLLLKSFPTNNQI